MMEDSQFAICDRRYFEDVCGDAQECWEYIERSYRSHDGEIIDHDEYNGLYVRRMEWILEKVIPQNHPCLKDYDGYHGLAWFLVEECNDIRWEEGEDPFFWRNYCFEELEIEELHQFLSELCRDYLDLTAKAS